MKVKSTMMALGAATMFMLPLSAAQAAETIPGATTAQTERPATSVQVTDDKLEEFAHVQQEVESLNMEYQQKIAETSDVKEKSTLMAEAEKEMQSLIEKSDLTLTEYNQIAQLVKQDPVLQGKYSKILSDM